MPCSSNFISKYPSTDKYHQTKHSFHPPTQSTSHAHNDSDPEEKENYGTTSQRINKFWDSKKEPKNNYEQNSTTETITEDSYLESEEIPFQPNLFYFTRKSKKTSSNLIKVDLNQALEQAHSHRNGLDLTLPLMEQDIDFNAHIKSSAMLSTNIEKASCETVLIDVIGIDSPTQKVSESFQSDVFKHQCQNINTFQNIQEIPLTGKISLFIEFLQFCFI